MKNVTLVDGPFDGTVLQVKDTTDNIIFPCWTDNPPYLVHPYLNIKTPVSEKVVYSKTEKVDVFVCTENPLEKANR